MDLYTDPKQLLERSQTARLWMSHKHLRQGTEPARPRHPRFKKRYPDCSSSGVVEDALSGCLTTQRYALQSLCAPQHVTPCCFTTQNNSQVGAGTMNPATFLRVLGPEPWNVSYTEPSIRPDDSRYGLNPNRVQRHTQYQVILKPDPGNPQESSIWSPWRPWGSTRACTM